MGTTPPPFESKDLTVISYRRRTFECYPVLGHELRTLISGYTSVYLALFGMAFGAFVVLLVTVLTVQLEASARRFFMDSTVITVCFSVLLGVMAGRDWWRSRSEMKKLTKETAQVEVRHVNGGTF
jgi:uncharacterized protein YacL